MIAAFIALLALPSSPSAILGRVPKIVVNPIKCHPCWSMTHVAQKCCKAITPLIANSYATSTIMFIRTVSRVKAAIFDARPYSVFRATTSPMRREFLASHVDFVTTTTFRIAGSKTRGIKNGLVAAIAYTKPTGLAGLRVGCTCFNKPTIKSLPSKILKIVRKHQNLIVQVEGEKQA